MPTAPSDPLPELAEFLAPFRVRFTRREGTAALERHCTGLPTEHPNKNFDTLAQLVPGTSEQQLQGLLTAMAWGEGDLNRQRVGFMAGLPTEGDGVLVFDDTGFAKPGRSSVGVARQHSGTLGRTGNCQVAVTGHYAERTLAWPVAARLYLPRHWAGDAGRRAKAGVPGDVTFRTKPELALGLLDQAKKWGVRWSCVTADCDYGDNPNFLAGLDARRQRYVVAVRADFAVSTARRTGQSPERADALLGELPAGVWRSVRWREGSKGWLRGTFAAVRCWRVTSGGTRHVGWLIGEREARGAAGAAEVLLEQPRATGAAGEGGRVRPPAAPGGAVLRGGEDAARVEPVPGPTVGRVPLARGRGDAGVLVPGVARVPAAVDATPPGRPRPAFSPSRWTPGAAPGGGPGEVSDWLRLEAIREWLGREDIAAWFRPMRK